ncbi:MAG: NAD-dependent epimerase/dehydratase family protein [Alphaproteobacteria bacterium]|nr:NAD-dependent epimerase/dehydratase family protein [Alphaproteobacteria bacterium]
MKVVITGGLGFLGQRLGRLIWEKGSLAGPDGAQRPVSSMVLFDVAVPATPPDGFDDRTTLVQGEIADPTSVRALIDTPDIAVFHLASVVSGEGEKDFDLAMRVNLDGGRHILEACRALGSRPRLLFASSVATFGGAVMTGPVGDGVKQTPQTTYGMTKAVLELMINDYTRKGFVDGRSARLPTVIVRPGKPNAAASSFFSGLFREPLNGVDCTIPVPLSVRHPVIGYRAVVEGMRALYEADGAAIGDDRAVTLPSQSVTVEDLVAALRRVAGDRALGTIDVKPDPFIEEIVATWPQAATSERARALGLPADPDLDSIVRAFIDDYVDA